MEISDWSVLTPQEAVPILDDVYNKRRMIFVAAIEWV